MPTQPIFSLAINENQTSKNLFIGIKGCGPEQLTKECPKAVEYQKFDHKEKHFACRSSNFTMGIIFVLVSSFLFTVIRLFIGCTTVDDDEVLVTYSILQMCLMSSIAVCKGHTFWPKTAHDRSFLVLMAAFSGHLGS